MTAASSAMAAGSACGRRDRALDPEMAERVDRPLEGLRAAGAEPPRVDGPAARLGITPAVIDQLRAGGVLRQIAPWIDYPADVWSTLSARVADMSGPMSVGRLRDALHTSRRHAEAILGPSRATPLREAEARRAASVARPVVVGQPRARHATCPVSRR